MTVRYAQVRPDARLRWVELAGPDPARVYLHGLGSSSPVYYAGVLARPALADRRSLLVDLLGFGISDRPADFSYTLADQAAAVATALDEAGVSAAEVIGHSMGGSVAILLARLRPDLVSRLVVVEPNLDPTPRPRIARWTEQDFVAEGFTAELSTMDSEWVATMRLADPVAVYRSERALGDTSLRDALADLPMPRIFIEGGLTEPLPDRDTLADEGVEFRVVPDAGHNVMLDAPDAFVAALR